MELLEEHILSYGKVYPGNILKVDSFLNHCLDINLLTKLGGEFYRLFGDCGVTKILTIESSGIALACTAAPFFDVPVLFAKKHRTLNLSPEVYTTEVDSFTHGCTYTVAVSKNYLLEGDRVLIIDDFLAKGNALIGLIDLCRQAGAETVGAGIAIEKAFQGGGDRLRETGLRIESLAMIDSMSDDGTIIFRH